MIEDKSRFRSKVFAIVAQIPYGRVASYSQVAALAGEPRAAWEVGQIAHFGPSELPWHRVVRRDGGLARGFPGGPEHHRSLLEEEAIEIKDDRVAMERYQWQAASL